MLCTTYRLRYKGQKLDADVIRRDGCLGETTYRLRVIGTRPEWHIMSAAFAVPGSDRYVFPVLDRARLLKIRGDGMLITGIQIIPISRGIKNIKADYFPQTWWCVPRTYTQDDAPEPTKTPTKLGWREESGIEHERRQKLPEPDSTFKDRTQAPTKASKVAAPREIRLVLADATDREGVIRLGNPLDQIQADFANFLFDTVF